ncbi:hypothetical protein [Turicibacter sp.]|uniref:hypothetical protein n=1 Tax=Turicibacter sp. TaxID=2049042 RepID=UPI001B3EEF03|nr:hypothetical protein [Turicibacter sp.]MBP3904614.1 hypothetical protein [Turicibacter sp.]
MAKLELTYEMEKALGRNRNTVLALWYKIEYFQNKYGYCDKTNNDFSRMLGISLATVKRCMTKLIELGLVSKVKSDYWHRKLFAVRPATDVKNNVSEPINDPTSEPIYNNVYKKIKLNNVVSIKEEEATLNEIEIEILKDEFEEEIVTKSIHVFNMAKNEQKIFNPFKYTRGICLNIIRNKKALERKQAKKEAYEQKQLTLFEEMAKNRKETIPTTVDPNYYYDWMAF